MLCECDEPGELFVSLCEQRARGRQVNECMIQFDTSSAFFFDHFTRSLTMYIVAERIIAVQSEAPHGRDVLRVCAASQLKPFNPE